MKRHYSTRFRQSEPVLITDPKGEWVAVTAYEGAWECTRAVTEWQAVENLKQLLRAGRAMAVPYGPITAERIKPDGTHE